MKFIKMFEIFESSEPPIEVGSKWMSKSGWGDISDLYLSDDDNKKAIFTVLNISDKGKRISYKIKYNGNPNPDKVFTKGRKNFLNDLKPKFKWDNIKESDNVDKKNMYVDRLSGEDDLELNFNKSEYLDDERAIIGAYFITKDNEKSIEVMNIKEFASQTAIFMDGSMPYSVTFHKVILPKSQIEIISEVEGKPGFFYIKIPYWLFQTKKVDLYVKRVTGKKGIDIRDHHYSDKKFMNWFKDPDVLRYITISDPGSLAIATRLSKRV